LRKLTFGSSEAIIVGIGSETICCDSKFLETDAFGIKMSGKPIRVDGDVTFEMTTDFGGFQTRTVDADDSRFEFWTYRLFWGEFEEEMINRQTPAGKAVGFRGRYRNNIERDSRKNRLSSRFESRQSYNRKVRPARIKNRIHDCEMDAQQSVEQIIDH
jgi:hypothetical protein